MTKPWYASGLRFECTQCGKCCTGPPPPGGAVFVTPQECRALARHLGLPIKTFLRTFTVRVGRRRSLRNAKAADHCILLDPIKKTCTVHELKPTQCRTFPFWRRHVESPDDWVRVARACEGVGQGPLITESEITSRLKSFRARISV